MFLSSMDTSLMHRFWGELVLEPIFHNDFPLVTVILNDEKLFDRASVDVVVFSTNNCFTTQSNRLNNF